MATYLLSGELVRQKLSTGKESVDLARDSLNYWLTKNCPMCKGTGVLDIEQHQCPMCGGTGKRYRPESYEGALRVIEGALEWMEAQLHKRLVQVSWEDHKETRPTPPAPNPDNLGY
jgi:hypothetical protein